MNTRLSQTYSASLLLLIGFVLNSCATYYHKNVDFNQEFQKGDLRVALETLKKNDKEANGRTRFIYYANNGLLHATLGHYEESNAYFEKAFIFGEDYRIQYLNEAASYFTNPMVTMYRGEDHEHLMVLYYKAINFLKMNRHDEALVECRRLNIRLNQLSDRYSSEQKFKRDAFIHTLMGIIYQSAKDYNNAFIAYRNAVEVYEEDYSRMFGIDVPEQVKKDLLNTAYWTGFTEEFEKFKEKFEMPTYTPNKPDAELVFFWHNGLAPVKDEWSINFMIAPGPDNMMIFSNPELNMTFPFRVDNEKDKRDLSSLQVFRVAFPRYVERPSYYTKASLSINGSTYPLALTESINRVAFYSLQQRMFQEFAKGLLRAALKKATEQSLRKEDERLGALLGLVNVVTEKADTRNWQTLPHSIYYSRLPLQEGANQVTFKLDAGRQLAEHNFTYQARSGQTLFHTFSSLETTSAPYRYY